MNLATEKFSALLAERDELVKNDVCIRFIGDLTRLPVKLQKLIAELMLLTKDHTTKCLNVCMAYTSSYELSCAANRVYNAVNQNVLSDEIGLEDLSACLLTNRSRTGPELLIRQVGARIVSEFRSSSLWLPSNPLLILFCPQDQRRDSVQRFSPDAMQLFVTVVHPLPLAGDHVLRVLQADTAIPAGQAVQRDAGHPKSH